jgi:hypothetical protein
MAEFRGVLLDSRGVSQISAYLSESVNKTPLVSQNHASSAAPMYQRRKPRSAKRSVLCVRYPSFRRMPSHQPPETPIVNPQSSIPNRQSPIVNPQSSIANRQSSIANPQSPIPNRQQCNAVG